MAQHAEQQVPLNTEQNHAGFAKFNKGDLNIRFQEKVDFDFGFQSIHLVPISFIQRLIAGWHTLIIFWNDRRGSD